MSKKGQNKGKSNQPGQDLTRILEEWPYEQGKINVRLVDGADGEQRIQLRLDLGILQMRISGRPDGVRPHGFDSLLEFHEHALEDLVHNQGSASEFVLNPDACRELREEALQYYHRYVCLMVLEDFEGVVRDTSRNLRVLDTCAKFAETESDRKALESVRPYIVMMRTRAQASQAILDNEPKAAIAALDIGIEALRQYFAENQEFGTFDQSNEVQILLSMKDALMPKLPVSQKSELKQRLADALAKENYELAAILRDELRSLKE